MNNNKNIYILSRPIRTGKTSQLSDWAKDRVNIGGLLTPDVNGSRMIFDLRLKTFHSFEVKDTYSGEKVTIGHFLFAKSAFAKAQDILMDALLQSLDWIIIDEVGKLEIEQGEGLEPSVLRVVRAFQSGLIAGKLLLVIRDTLLEMAIEKYELVGCRILTNKLPD